MGALDVMLSLGLGSLAGLREVPTPGEICLPLVVLRTDFLWVCFFL